jgi:hypothetical protein
LCAFAQAAACRKSVGQLLLGLRDALADLAELLGDPLLLGGHLVHPLVDPIEVGRRRGNGCFDFRRRRRGALDGRFAALGRLRNGRH